LACPGGVFASPESFFACPGGVISRPESFFACPGGTFTWAGSVTEAGGWRVAAAGDSVSGGAGFSGRVTAGGVVDAPEPCFVWPAFVAWAGCRTTGVAAPIGVATAPDDREVVGRDVLSFAFGMVGA